MRRKGMMDGDNKSTMMSRSKHLSFFSSFSHRSVNLTFPSFAFFCLCSPTWIRCQSQAVLGVVFTKFQRAHPVLLRLD
ncbi:hypothetical protein DTO282F9_5340 [Paecilomyces variotii]|nr:hypothetical protein DTO282F9_5340 [Paecilomyces variotii]